MRVMDPSSSSRSWSEKASIRPELLHSEQAFLNPSDERGKRFIITLGDVEELFISQESSGAVLLLVNCFQSIPHSNHITEVLLSMSLLRLLKGLIQEPSSSRGLFLPFQHSNSLTGSGEARIRRRGGNLIPSDHEPAVSSL